ncbi:ImmA/IrrE family metallo-endopeptidase [Actinophytocola sp.]|uniref:ImmA/IrrE family metallo-endopeptidase n=1 Tax=Actinophytocola sp. TaxID=1872138 RepID=UPI003C70FE7E
MYVHDQEVAEIDAAVQQLPIPQPFTMGGLARALSEREGKPVKLIGEQLGGTVPCGWLVRTKEVDYVCYPTNTSYLHQLHIVLHEIGHLVLRHHAMAIATLGQSPTDTAVERAAELFATSASRRIWREQQTRNQTQPPQAADVIALGAVFSPVPETAGD